MFTAWFDLFKAPFTRDAKKEFISADARHEMHKDTRSYEMLSRERSVVVTPLSPVKTPPQVAGRRTPDYFGPNAARYHAPAKSFSSPRPPQHVSWDAEQTFARPASPGDVNPLGMNRI